MRPECGCGAPAEYLCYEDEQPHCEECHRAAIEGPVGILVRIPLDWGEWYETRGKNQSGR